MFFIPYGQIGGGFGICQAICYRRKTWPNLCGQNQRKKKKKCHIYAKFLYKLMEAGVTSGSAALAAEVRKHNANDAKCSELGWSCIPIAVETYGCLGAEAMQMLSRLASRLATRGNCSKSHLPVYCMAGLP